LICQTIMEQDHEEDQVVGEMEACEMETDETKIEIRRKGLAVVKEGVGATVIELD